MNYNQIKLDSLDAWSSLCRRPLRSLLSSLGVGIGVAALVAMLSISEGAKRKALEKIVSLGTNTLRVENSIQSVKNHKQSRINLSRGLIEDDAEKITHWVGSRGEIGAYYRKDNVQISSGSRTVTGTVLAVNEAWFRAEKLSLQWGRFLNKNDELNQKKYCVVGKSIKEQLMLEGYGRLRLANLPMDVVGLLTPRGSLLSEGTGLSALDFDQTVMIPISSSPFYTVIGGRKILDGMVIALKSEAESDIFHIADQIDGILRDSHNSINDFKLVIAKKLLEEARESQRLFALIMGTIAGLSLIVGGIGVMNVMLANISEQTREIGLRMALGATKGRIIWLYLWNSILLAAGGAFWGSIVGVIIAILVQKYGGWDVSLSTFSLSVAPLSAILTGVIFGLHPAFRAAALDPAIALNER